MINVKSETGTLKKVLLHRPGVELEQLTPEALETLLFDDIPYLKVAKQEHDTFSNILVENGVQVIRLSRLITETLDIDFGIKKEFIKELIKESYNSIAHTYEKELTSYLLDFENTHDLILSIMGGIKANQLEKKERNPLSSLLNDSRTSFALDPIPNLYFTRDSFATIGNGVTINHMYSRTRRRETIFGKYIFKYHPEYNKTPIFYTNDIPHNIEGGDILNINENLLLIGLSQRTSSEAIERLAINLFKHPQSKVNKIIALDIPNIRAYMHLDTVFTQVDINKFVIHPNILDNLRIFIITPKENGYLKVEEYFNGLKPLLSQQLERDDIQLISCGGNDYIASAREQWNDGSNTLCIAPGKVIVYDRNTITNKILQDYGIQTLEIPSSELSRGRGGPRCMSMPLERIDT
jgi:arginine deiminase